LAAIESENGGAFKDQRTARMPFIRRAIAMRRHHRHL
jgi:hypothetical protein